MIALLTSLEEQLGADSRFVHIGLTSNDVSAILTDAQYVWVGTLDGNRLQSGSRSMTRASTCDTSSPGNSWLAVNIS